jgi:hypothetical protein
MTNIEIKTFEFTPSNIGDYLFNIPIYQRLYAWEEAEIKQLLEDLYRQFEKPKPKETEQGNPYYLGNLVLFKNENSRYDVIDGQQRLTTLFLLGLVFKENYSDWSNFLQKENNIRLAFVAREDDNAFLKAKVVGNNENIATENLNAMMINALRVIKEFQYSNNVSFQEYVYNQTTMVGIIIPEGIDLNKYFEDMNNRGVQLEKHEILKVKLLAKIDEKERLFYARLWDACSQMNQYVEYGFDKTLQEIRKCLLGNDMISELQKLSFGNDNGQNTLGSILNPNPEKEPETTLEQAQNAVKKEAEKQKNTEQSPTKIGSIINFPKFILHTYKIWKNDANSKLSDTDLLEVFNETMIESIDAQGFIHFLFTCRVLYDAYFIKSVEGSEGKTSWEINNISKTKKKDKENEFDYERDNDELKETAVIQAMLNASTSLDNWFTPALKYVRENEKTLKDSDFSLFLEDLDTEMAKKRIGNDDYKEWFNQNLHKGTGTPRYWFFRLDYYLRKKWLKENAVYPKLVDISKIKNYQFRTSRSVEHIQPQSKKEGWEKDGVTIDNFGNLVLISVSSNSSYNNQDFQDKKPDFQKRTDKWGVESLKQLAIFEYIDWTTDNADAHGKIMVDILVDSMMINSKR